MISSLVRIASGVVVAAASAITTSVAQPISFGNWSFESGANGWTLQSGAFVVGPRPGMPIATDGVRAVRLSADAGSAMISPQVWKPFASIRNAPTNTPVVIKIEPNRFYRAQRVIGPG